MDGLFVVPVVSKMLCRFHLYFLRLVIAFVLMWNVGCYIWCCGECRVFVGLWGGQLVRASLGRWVYAWVVCYGEVVCGICGVYCLECR